MFTPTHQTEMNGSFLPEEYVARRAELRAGVLGIVLFGVVMTLVIGAFLVTNQRWRSVRAEAAAVHAEYEDQKLKIQQLEALERDREVMLEKAEIVSALVEKTPRSLLMSELVSRMPPGMTMLDFRLEGKRVEAPKPEPAKTATGPRKVGTLSGSKSPVVKGKPGGAKPGAVPEAPPPREKILPPRFDHKISITGVTAVNAEVTDYLTRLNECPLLQNVDLIYIREAKIDGVFLRRFEITANLRASPPKGFGLDPASQMADVESRSAAASEKE
ncbi:MAG: PilN domain-containing protein [Phycisphaeraceae bacterium]|nr:PilN domain-containing protein [Phycisphaerae bacterium]MBX3391992.1 PilN domain-containing protein [Phycisphaeraceae bacterium]HRJ50463.1 PilN domain-containing protein [Phycisphaerales bacterium]